MKSYNIKYSNPVKIKYLYFLPDGGINDSFQNIWICYEYCKKYDRTLLIDFEKSSFRGFNFSDFFDLSLENVIYDTQKIKEIILSPSITSFFPKEIKKSTLLSEDFINHIEYYFSCQYYYNQFRKKDIPKEEMAVLELPSEKLDEDVIVYKVCGTGLQSFNVFKNLIFKDEIKSYLKDKAMQIEKPYISIQIRNNYPKSQGGNPDSYKELIQSNIKKFKDSNYKAIYVATDNLDVLKYIRNLKEIHLPIFENSIDCDISQFGYLDEKYKKSCLEVNDKKNLSNEAIKSIMCDIFAILNSNEFLSNSAGGFVKLISKLYNEKEFILDKIK